MPSIDLSILNQRQTPAFFASSLATRPSFGFPGRVFIDTDSPSTGLYRDTGTAWVQIADPGAGTTGTLQQVTTNGNTTNQGISITAGALTLGTASGDNQTLLNLPATNTLIYRENVGSLYGFNIFGGNDNSLFLTNTEGGYNQTLYFGDGQTTNIFGISASNDAGVNWNSVFVVNQDNKVGINTNAPTADFDVHSAVSTIAQLNQTVATNNSLLAFQNSGTGKWRIGNYYNAAAHDFGIFDVVNSAARVTVKNTGQTFIGPEQSSSGKLVVVATARDNGIILIGTDAPGFRINDGTEQRQVGIAMSTGSNDFIQGSVNRDFCIFNASKAAASPILFGIHDATLNFVIEAARISPARNFLIGTTTDSGQKLQVSGTSLITGAATFSSTGVFGKSNASPFKVLNVIADTADGFNDPVNFESYGTAGANILLRFAKGTYAAPTAISANNLMGSMGVRGYDGTAFSSGGRAGIYMYAAEDFTPTAQGTFLDISTTANGTTSRIERIRVQNNGNVLIGTTTDAGQKLQVNGNSYFNGNVGINNIAPAYKLDVTGPLVSRFSGFVFSSFDASTDGNIYITANLGQANTTNSNIIFRNSTSGGSIVEYMRLSNLGYLLIGTATNGASKLRIVGLPTSAVGLSSGDIYSNAGILTIVP